MDVFAGVPLEGVDIWLQPSPRRFQVAGRVLDPQGRPIENVAIEFGRAGSRADNIWTVSDPGGLFTLDRVPPGSVVLRARADSPEGPLVGVASVVLAVESARDLRIELQAPGRVRGRVVATAGALPAGLRVALLPTILRPSALYPVEEVPVDASGVFEAAGTVGDHELIVRGLPAGWRTRGLPPALWINPGQTIGEVRVEVGPITDRRP